MSNLTLTGILKVKKAESVVNDKFKKLEFVVTDTASQYTQHVSFQLTQDRTSLLDNVNEGDKITVSFNLRGREWTSPQGEVKYFNTLEAWKIEVVEKAAVSQASQDFEAHTSKAVNAVVTNPADIDPLPF